MLKNFFECFLTRSGYEKNFSNSFLPIWRTLPPIKRKLRKKKKYFNSVKSSPTPHNNKKYNNYHNNKLVCLFLFVFITSGQNGYTFSSSDSFLLLMSSGSCTVFQHFFFKL